jgi:hypothetical protein
MVISKSYSSLKDKQLQILLKRYATNQEVAGLTPNVNEVLN